MSDLMIDSDTDEPIFRINWKKCNLRRTEIIDVEQIQKLKAAWTTRIFGQQNVYDLLEKSILSITLEDKATANVIAYAAFFDYPKLATLQPDQLEAWFLTHLDASFTPVNTTFLNYLVASRGYEEICTLELIKAMFNSLVDIKYLVLIDTGISTEDIKFTEIFSHRVAIDSKQSVRICYRDDALPILHIRPALVDDNDDLIDLLGDQVASLTKNYGKFFFAELIDQQHDDLDYCLVAETSPHELAGFLSISKNINFSQLENGYELGIFNNLKQLYRVKLPKEKSDPASRGATSVVAGRGRKSPQPQAQQPGDPPASGTQTPVAMPEVYSAFVIHLFVMSDEHRYRYMEFIEAAFRLFPDKEYCITGMSCWSSSAPFLSKFTRVPPKPNSTSRQELYVLHRWGLIKNFSVRSLRSSDISNVTYFVSGINAKERLIKDLGLYCNNQRSSNGRIMQVFIAECTSQCVGVAVLCEEEDIEFLRAQYNIDDYIYFGLHRREDHANLMHFVLNPIFTHYARHFIKEIFRLGNKTCLYYRIYPPSPKVKQIVTVIEDFLPVTQRNVMLLKNEHLKNNLPSDRIQASHADFSLTILSKKHVFETKEIIRAKIVVVGASTTALACIKYFLDSPYIRLTHLYLVSPNGLPSEHEIGDISQIMIPNRSMSFVPDVKPAAVHMKINVIEGWMTEILREKQCIVIDNKYELPYNYLVLCCGRQYQVPKDYEILSPNITLLTVNNHEEAQEAVKVIKTMQERLSIVGMFGGKIVVQGNSLEAYCFVQALLKLSVPAANIILVETEQTLKDHCLKNRVFRHLLSTTLKTIGVQFLSGYTVDVYSTGAQSLASVKQTISLESQTHSAIRVANCKLLVVFSEENVNRNTFLAINKSSLVYDNGLIIDHEFRTNDPWILAAGPMTKFSRRYSTNSSLPFKLSSNKIGKQVAIQLFRVLHPNFDEEERNFTTNAAELLKDFTDPIVFKGYVPGNLQCFHICKRGECITQLQAMRRITAREIATGDALGFRQPYIHFYFNDNGIVESIVCISEKEINHNLWIKLFGHHKSTLNNVVSKFDDGLVTDLETYFSEPWCCALLHDRMADFMDEAKQIFADKVPLSSDIMEYLRALAGGRRMMNRDTRRKLEELFKPLGSYREVEEKLLKFLQYNRNWLPMYAFPDLITPNDSTP